MGLIIKNLTKHFDNKCIFNSFSYKFSDIGLYALLGKSGVGKTTLLRIIAGLDKKYEGEVLGGGFHTVSVAFQEYRLFPHLSAIDNLVMTLYKKTDEEKIKRCKNMLSRLGFSEVDMNLLPHEMSGGMQQRVSLARAFLKDASIILLDEPTKELDEENTRLVHALITEYSKSKLVIMVTHKPDDIALTSPTVINITHPFSNGSLKFNTE